MFGRFRALVILGAILLGTSRADAASVEQLLQGARAQVGETVNYDGSYRSIPYPGGDVPRASGVCTDVVVRAYRAVGLDLQKLVHEDMERNFALYPSKRRWGLSRPDSNIDHRRVPNLETFFSRFGKKLSVDLSVDGAEPGDLLVWMLPGALPHIGFVSDRKQGSDYLVIHNVGRGAKEEPFLGEYPLVGHYRYLPRDLFSGQEQR